MRRFTLEDFSDGHSVALKEQHEEMLLRFEHGGFIRSHGQEITTTFATAAAVAASWQQWQRRLCSSDGNGNVAVALGGGSAVGSAIADTAVLTPRILHPALSWKYFFSITDADTDTEAVQNTSGACWAASESIGG